MYTIAVRSGAQESPTTVVYDVPEYEVGNGVLTLAIDKDHDVLIPLFHALSIDIQRHD